MTCFHVGRVESTFAELMRIPRLVRVSNRAGWKDSIVGGGDITGKSAVRFWTKLKNISCKWNPDQPLLWLA
jgi:hypothetical protein